MSEVRDKVIKATSINNEAKDLMIKAIAETAPQIAINILKQFTKLGKCEELIKDVLECLTLNTAREIRKCVKDVVKEFESEPKK